VRLDRDVHRLGSRTRPNSQQLMTQFSILSVSLSSFAARGSSL
jgi:hypothetical protein